ncbi:uncharacterized protein LOC119773626 [Cyprinodon tularosa]|uniref:uncharacterized protein LOC119773626 n=1 Tax=Cyprinodon tularosa TaxID=77115 RepID=UPI0018E1E04D|nr:uncharacterized protein LOC119773626 [Cyprinodon tularosa]
MLPTNKVSRTCWIRYTTTALVVKSVLPFAVVDFLDGGGVSIVPCKWFTGPAEDSCFWPPGRVNINKVVRDEISPNTDWPQYRVRILGKAESYESARVKLRRSETTSDLQTESDSGGRLGKGKRKRRPVVLSSSDEWDDPAEQQETSTLSSAEERSSRITPHPNVTHPFVQPPTPTRPSPVVTQPNPRRLAQDTNANMFVRVLTLLEDIKDTQRVHSRMLQSLLKQRDGPVAAVLPEGARFPLQTVQDVEALEQKLLDPVFLKEVVAVVAEIGGSTVDEATRRMMAFIMDNPLSREYNFIGRHGKREFRGLKLFEVLYGPTDRKMSDEWFAVSFYQKSSYLHILNTFASL